MSTILCLSGGMDSVIAWYYLGKPKCIFFHTGVAYSDMEEQAIHKLGIPCIIDHSLCFHRETSIYIPHRNLLFASRASAHGQNVVIAGLKDDMVEDKTERAFEIMSDCLTAIGKCSVKVTSPFWKDTKEDICKWFVSNIPRAAEILELSISCYAGMNSGPCWECESCFRKACALFSVGIVKEFYNPTMIKLYRYRAEREHYDRSRCASILKYVNRL